MKGIDAMKIIHRIIRRQRYPLAMTGMILGVIIAYFSFSFAGRMGHEAHLEEEDLKESLTKEKMLRVDLFYNGNGEDILPVFRDESLESWISNVDLFSDDLECECLMNVYLSMPESFPYKVVEGSIPDQKQISSKEPIIVLGKGLKNVTVHRDNADFYRICGKEYRVVAYISAEQSNSLDAVRFLFYDCLEEKVKEEIDHRAMTMGLTVTLRSNTLDLMDVYNEKTEELGDKVQSVNFSREIDKIHIVDSALVEYQQYAYLLYLFALILIIMVTELWIVQRKKEFAIRRAVGYSRSQIIGMLAGELAKVIIGVGTMLLIGQMLVYHFIGTEYGNSNWSNLVIGLLFVVITFIVLMIYPVYKIMTDSIVSSIQDKGV